MVLEHKSWTLDHGLIERFWWTINGPRVQFHQIPDLVVPQDDVRGLDNHNELDISVCNVTKNL
jgi:hypothetical protein